MSCPACDRTRKFMSADPEMFRGEDMRCDAHQEVSRLREEVAELRKKIINPSLRQFLGGGE